MQISIVTPGVDWVATGNRYSADVFGSIFADMGHEVWGGRHWTPRDGGDLLVALHATKSHDSITSFRETFPDRPIIVVLTGTDIYPMPDEQALESISIADRLVCLQDRAPSQVPEEFRDKVSVIRHMAHGLEGEVPVRSLDPFEICVAGHLRDVKDPMRAAIASRLLPEDSKIRILHAGAILDEAYQPLVEEEMRKNPRYCWLGPLDPGSLKHLIARSQATVVSSLSEGGARVAGESVVLGTPVLGSRIDGLLGHFGDDYPAFFPVKDSEALGDLMHRLETDQVFREDLFMRTEEFQPLFHPSRERGAWKDLLAAL